jgi:hypothetical protein
MFEELIATLNKPVALNGFNYGQQMMNCTARLTQAQVKVIQGLYDEVGEELTKSLKVSSDRAAMVEGWTRLMATATQANAEAGALLMKNAQECQSELLEMAQSARADFSGQFMRDMAAIPDATTIANGGTALKAARAKKQA